MKKCSQCGEEKDESEFYKDKRHPDGLRYNCKVCQNKTRNEWRKANPENVKKTLKNYYNRNKEKWTDREKSMSSEEREKKRIRSNEFYYANKDELLKKRRGKYKGRPKEERVGYSQDYYDRHKEEIRAKARENYLNKSEEQKRSDVERTKLWRQNNRDKMRAWSAVGNAIIRGDLVKPLKCSRCNCKEKLHGHHEDYSKPLEVLWICHLCHMELHAKKNRNHKKLS